MGLFLSRPQRRNACPELVEAVLRLPQVTDALSSKDLRAVACVSRGCDAIVSTEQVWRVKFAERLAVHPASLPLPPARATLNGYMLRGRVPRQPPLFFEMTQALALHEHFLRHPESVYRPGHADLLRADELLTYVLNNFVGVLEVSGYILEGFRTELIRHTAAESENLYADTWAAAHVMLLGGSGCAIAGAGAYIARHSTGARAANLGALAALGPVGLKILALMLLLDAGLIASDVCAMAQANAAASAVRRRRETELHGVRMAQFEMPAAIEHRRAELRQPQLRQRIVAMLQGLELADAHP